MGACDANLRGTTDPGTAAELNRSGFRMLLAALVIVVPGCYTPSRSAVPMQRAVDARELYRDPGFGIERLERHGVTSLAGRLSFGHETFGYVLGQGFIEALQARVGDAALHPNEAINRINQSKLTNEYERMLATYDNTHILDAGVLAKISNEVKVRYFAVPILVNFSEDFSTRFSLFGVRVGKTASATARFQLQVWDGDTGTIVWEGLSDLTLGHETVREERIRIDHTIQATWESLIDQMPSIDTSQDD